MNPRLSVLVAAIAACVSIGASTISAATVIVADTFTSTTNHTEYGGINGETPEVTTSGVGNWVAKVPVTSSVTPSRDGLYTYRYSAGSNAEVAIPTPSTAVAVTVVFDTASLFGAPGGWCSVGFQNSASNNWFTPGNFCLQVFPADNAAGQGAITVFNGWGTTIQNITGLTMTTLEKISLQYDPVAHTYNVFANDVDVSGTQTLASAYPTIGSAGLVGNVSDTPAHLSGWVRFATTFEVSAVPEPATLGLLSLTTLALLRRRHA